MNHDNQNLAVIDQPADGQALATIAPPTIEQTLAVAVERGMTGDGIDKLAQVYEREMARRARRAFIDALRSFREECPPILKNRAPEGAKFRYADLEEITKIVDPILFRNGLAYRWDTEMQDDRTVVTCHLSHVDGHTESSHFSCLGSGTKAMNSMQIAASAVTYGRRYSLTGAIGITVDTDDDGRRAVANPQPPADPAAPRVGTREEGHTPQSADDGTPRVTKMMLGNLFAGWHAKHPDEPKTSIAFAEWVVGTLKLDCAPVTLTNVNGWSIDLVASVREVLNGSR